MRAGDFDQAALRVDALMRVDPGMPEGAALIGGLEAAPAGRTALARRLALGPGWTERYFQIADGADPAILARKQDVALQLAKLGTRNCDVLFALVEGLRRAGAHEAARTVWSAHCGDPGPKAGVADTQFVQLARDDAKPAPFGWRFIRSGEIQAGLVPEGKGAYRIQASNSGDIGLPLVAQPVAWPAGHYRLQVDAQTQGELALGRVFASLNCGDEPQRPVHLEGDVLDKGQILEARDCADQVLALWLRPGEDPVSIANVRVEKVD